MMQPQTPSHPVEPTVNPAVVTAGGTPISGSPNAVYEGFRAQRRELASQLDELESTRRSIVGDLRQLPAGSPELKVLQDRLIEINGRISTVDKMLADAQLQVSRAAAVPGAAIEPQIAVGNPIPEEAFILGAIFMFVFLLPLSIAFARRIWRRSSSVVSSIPKEIADRLGRMEQAVEATAIEVERIGEGQRFITRLFTEGDSARVLSGASAQLVPRELEDAPRTPG